MVSKTHAPPPAAYPSDANARLAAVPHTDDVVEYTLRCVLALAPSLSKTITEAADRQVRDLFGRSTAYVAVRAGDGRTSRNDAIRRDHLRGERVAYLCRRYNLTRSQIHRILGHADPGADVASGT